MGRNILFITTDQQRYDALGCNGSIINTPVVDKLASEGVNFSRAYCNNAVCAPARTTMFTGLYPRTHGVIANGYACSSGEHGIASWLKKKAGYRSALIGKAHFEPMYDLFMKFKQNRMAAEGSNGPWMGFDFVDLALHGPMAGAHYTKWLMDNHPEMAAGFGMGISGESGGDTGAPEVKYNPIPRELYHTDWVADRTIDYIDTLGDDDNWFIWMSFPDPHHPFDPPESEARRYDWRELPLPPGHPGSDEKIIKILEEKPQHWLDYYMGLFRNPEGSPQTFIPRQFTHDQLRELTALIYAMNELVDEACGRVLDHLDARGWLDDTDIIYTCDHGDMQGDFGFMFKGPYHVDSLMRIPMIYRPGKSAGVKPCSIDQPVSQVDLLPTFCDAAGVTAPPWAQGQQLPVSKNESRERAVCTWDSQHRRVGMHMLVMYRDGYTINAYLPSTKHKGGRFPIAETFRGKIGRVPRYSGTEGELYDHRNDPHQWHNLWDDPKYRSIKSDLLADLYDNIPPARKPPLKAVAPV